MIPQQRPSTEHVDERESSIRIFAAAEETYWIGASGIGHKYPIKPPHADISSSQHTDSVAERAIPVAGRWIRFSILVN